MEQIIVQVRVKEKARVLLELLTALDFVDSVETKEDKVGTTVGEKSLDFFSLAGLWQDREITLASIRQKAWPRQYS